MRQRDPRGWRFPDGQYRVTLWVCPSRLTGDVCRKLHSEPEALCGWMRPWNYDRMFERIHEQVDTLTKAQQALGSAARAVTEGIVVWAATAQELVSNESKQKP